MSVAWIALLAAVLAFPAPSSAVQAPRAFAYVNEIEERTLLVGRQALLTIVVAMQERPQGSPALILPDVSGGLLLEVSGRPTYGNEPRHGRQYQTWSYTLAFYPQRPGPIEIGPVEVELSQPLGAGQWQQIKVSTQANQLNAVWPPGAENIPGLVTTRDLEWEVTWHPEGSTLGVGEALTRTFIRRAPELLSMSFPPPPVAEIQGVGLYPKTPGLEDSAYRGRVSGERNDTMVYVFEQPGEIEIPAFVFHWYDIDASKLVAVEIPSRKLRILPAAVAAGTESQKAFTKPGGTRFFLMGIFTLLASGLLGAISVRQVVPVIQRRYRNSEYAAFRKVTNAAALGDTALFMRQTAPWLRHHGLTSLGEFTARADDPQLRRRIEDLLKLSFGKKGGGAPAGQLVELAESFGKFRKRGRSSPSAAGAGLPDLNA